MTKVREIDEQIRKPSSTAPGPAEVSLAAYSLVDEVTADSILGKEELNLRARLRSVLSKEVAPRAAEWDRTSEFAGPSYQALAKADLGNIIFPKKYGGLELSTLAYGMAVEEIGAACGSTSLIYATQTHAAYPIFLAGTEEQRSRYIPALGTGTMYGSLALTEPDAGSDAAAIRTVARRDGEDYILNGSKIFITTGDRANIIVCFATVDPGLGRSGITAFLLNDEMPGLSRGRVLKKLGMRGSSTAELFFDDLRVPASARLGPERGGWDLTIRSVVKSRISAAAQGVGIARAAYALALGWAHSAGALGRGGDSRTESVLADVRSQVLSARLMLYQVTSQIDALPERDHNPEISMIKFFCTDVGFNVSKTVVELLGPVGDLMSSPAERYLRDVKATQIYDGTNQVQRMLVARDNAHRFLSNTK
jgi:alkylation response protein AidB-like acyl-CoA dehydrogenase